MVIKSKKILTVNFVFILIECLNDTFITKIGHAVAQLVEILLHKPTSSGFDSRWCQWDFLLT
jgi:hypothetical protein